MRWAKTAKAGKPAAKCVLLLLADYADEHGVCFPSQERIAEESGQSVDSVQRHLKKLESIPLIKRRRRGLRNGRRAVTLYKLLIPTATETAHAPAALSASNGTTPQSATPQIPPNDTATVRQEPLIEPPYAAADAREKPSKPLISTEAFALSAELIGLQRLDHQDPRCIEAECTAQMWLTKGWSADVILQTVRKVMARLAKAPRTLRYFEEAIAEAHAERDRALPVASKDSFSIGSPTKRFANGTHQNGGGFAHLQLEFARRAAERDDPDHS
jgi:hypothetical protein